MITENGKFKRDIITLENELVDEGVPLLETVVRKGKIACDRPSLSDIRQNTAMNFSKLPEIFKKLDTAPAYPVEFSRGLTELRADIVEKIKREEIRHE